MFQMFSLLLLSTSMLALSLARINEYVPSSNFEDMQITKDWQDMLNL